MITPCRRFRAGPLLAGVAAAGGLALAASVRTPAPAGKAPSWDDYRLLVDRNIFRRDRRAARAYTPRSPASMPVAYDSDASIVLTGIARHDGQFVAFLEDAGAGTLRRAGVGQAAGKGRIVAITLDQIEYDRDGTVRRIGLRQSLAGTAAPVAVARAATLLRPPSAAPRAGAPATAPAETEPATQPARVDTPSAETDSNTSDILERMLRRRQEELRR